jgi:Outer membrane protein beta-barrel domain
MRYAPCLFAALVAVATPAWATPVAVGVFAGASLPIQQDDTATGAQIGVRVPIGIVPYLSVEPYYAATFGGSVQERIQGWDYTRSGFDIHTFGLNVDVWHLRVVSGLTFDPYVGIGARRLSRPGSDTKTHVGYDIGLGFEVAATDKFSLQVRGELEIVDVGDTSRKFANLTGGVAYRLR